MSSQLEPHIQALLNLLPEGVEKTIREKSFEIQAQIDQVIRSITKGKSPISFADFQHKNISRPEIPSQEDFGNLSEVGMRVFETLSASVQVRVLKECESALYYEAPHLKMPHKKLDETVYFDKTTLREAIKNDTLKVGNPIAWNQDLLFNHFTQQEREKYFHEISGVQILTWSRDHFKGIPEEEIVEVLGKIHSLKTLTLNFGFLSAPTVQAISKCFSSLSLLIVLDDEYTKTSTENLRIFLKNHTNLRGITLQTSYLKRIPENDFKTCFSPLDELRGLYHRFQGDYLPLVNLQRFGNSFHSLRNLSLSSKEIISENLPTWQQILPFLPNLHALTLTHGDPAKYLPKEEVSGFFQMFKELRALTISYPCMTELQDSMVAVFTPLQHLMYLELIMITLPKNEDFLRDFGKQLASLGALRLRACSLFGLTSENAKIFFGELKALKHLDIQYSGLSKKNEAFFKAILDSLPGLESLGIMGEEIVTLPRSQWQIIKEAKHLKHVCIKEFGNLGQFVPSILDDIAQACTHLETLEIETSNMNLNGTKDLRALFSPLKNLRRIQVSSASIPEIEKAVPELKGKLMG